MKYATPAAEVAKTIFCHAADFISLQKKREYTILIAERLANAKNTFVFGTPSTHSDDQRKLKTA